MARKKPPPTRIQKSGKGHQYFLDGEKVPGVTTIIDRGIPKNGLIGWAGRVPAEFVMNALTVDADGSIRADELVRQLRAWNATREPWQQVKLSSDPLPRLGLAEILAAIRYKDSDEAGSRGTEVHRYAEQLARGETVHPPEAIRDHVATYVEFLNKWQPRNALLERVVINRRWRYMGKLDMIAEFPDAVWGPGPWEGRPVGVGLVDVKTSRSGIFAETALQLAGYRFAETMIEGDGEIVMPRVDWVGAVHVRADGYDVVPFDVGDNPKTDETFRTFLYAKQVGDWLDFREGPAAEIKLPPASIVKAAT